MLECSVLECSVCPTIKSIAKKTAYPTTTPIHPSLPTVPSANMCSTTSPRSPPAARALKSGRYFEEVGATKRISVGIVEIRKVERKGFIGDWGGGGLGTEVKVGGGEG